MVTEMITLKLEKSFLQRIDTFVSKASYQNRTEFIRNALREKLNDIQLRDAVVSLSQLSGAGKSSKKYEAVRQEAFEKISQMRFSGL